MHTHQLFLDAVVNCEGEVLGKASVIGMYDLMNSCVNEEGVDV